MHRTNLGCTFPVRLGLIGLLLLGSSCARAGADEGLPLHQRIDQLLAESAPDFFQRASPLAGDAEFLRRVYLDLVGRIPSAIQAREFLRDGAPDKRTRLVDELLASPAHARHMQYRFDVVLMERRPEKHVKLAAWRNYLLGAFRENKPWSQLARELLSADGAEPAARAPARFLLDRELNNDEATRDIGRIFLGRDLECAQCHDHPEIDGYLQRHYYGLSAFLQRSYLFKDPESKLTSIGEKAEGAVVKFTSVFTNEQGETHPRVLELPEITDPPVAAEPYLAKPDKKTRGVPKYSRRLQLATALTSPQQPAFRRNIANRLWALMMGRGLVEPLDMLHEANPPSHPQLLSLLAEDLLAHDYDMRRTIRELVLSQAYQRSSKTRTEERPDQPDYTAGLLKPLTPEQLAWSTMQATGVVDQTRRQVVQRLSAEHPDVDPASVAYAYQLEQALHDELLPHVQEFVAVFGASNQQLGLNATADQALFMMNGELLAEWLQPVPGGLCARLVQCTDRAGMVDELYLSTLTRTPTQAERESVEQFLRSFGEDRRTGIQELIRTILCSAEFRLNH